MFSNNTTGVGEICYVSESPMRILVVEDDEKIASFVVNGLKQSGFAVDRAKDGEQGLDFALSVSYDAAVLDLLLPQLDGLSLLRQLRQKKVSLPVLILSARASVDDRVLGLQSGGDDYLTKPFAFSELLGSRSSSYQTRHSFGRAEPPFGGRSENGPFHARNSSRGAKNRAPIARVCSARTVIAPCGAPGH